MGPSAGTLIESLKTASSKGENGVTNAYLRTLRGQTIKIDFGRPDIIPIIGELVAWDSYALVITRSATIYTLVYKAPGMTIEPH
jgi:hypothetical protein